MSGNRWSGHSRIRIAMLACTLVPVIVAASSPGQNDSEKVVAANKLLAQATQMSQAGNYDGAVQSLIQATQLVPTSDVLWNRLGDLELLAGKASTDLLKARQCYQDAITHFQKAIEINPAQVRYPSSLHEAYARLDSENVVGISSSAQTQSTQNGKTNKRQRFVGKGPWAAVDFANFTYSKTCLGEHVRVVNAQASRGEGPEARTLYVTSVQYGDITGDGRDDAIVSTVCEWARAANPGADLRGIYIYEIVGGKPTFVTEFKEPSSNPSDLPRGVWEADLTDFEVANGTLSVEHFAGEARCCPTLYVKRTYRWNGSIWIQVAVKTRPYESR